MLNNFIYAQTKDLFLEELSAGNILDEAIVFIENTKEIWNHGHYFGGGVSAIDPEVINELQSAVVALQSDKANKTELSNYALKSELPSLDGYLTQTAANNLYATVSSYNTLNQSVNNLNTSVANLDTKFSDYKPIQTKVNSPSASGSTTAFIDTISQDTNGKITVTKKNVSTAGANSLGIVKGFHRTSGTASGTQTTNATNSPAVNSRTTTSNRYYGVETDSAGKMYVNVPWEKGLSSESDPVFSASAASGITSTDITNWNSKTSNVGTITEVKANGTSISTSGTANIPAASTSAYGVTKLSNSISDTSTTLAATANTVKQAYDLANGKQDKITAGTGLQFSGATLKHANSINAGEVGQTNSMITLDPGTLDSVLVPYIEYDSEGHITRTYETVVNVGSAPNYYPSRTYTSGLKISDGTNNDVCALYVPYASDTSSGVVSNDIQTFGGQKRFTGGICIGYGTTAGTDDGAGRAIIFVDGELDDAFVYLQESEDDVLVIRGRNGIILGSDAEITANASVYAPSFYESSDERLKTFGDNIQIDFETLKKLPKKYFEWVEKPGKLEIGTSAQEVQKLYPEIVNENKDGMLSVDYSKLSIVALKAVDELYDKTKELEERINRLEKLIQDVK